MTTFVVRVPVAGEVADTIDGLPGMVAVTPPQLADPAATAIPSLTLVTLAEGRTVVGPDYCRVMAATLDGEVADEAAGLVWARLELRVLGTGEVAGQVADAKGVEA